MVARAAALVHGWTAALVVLALPLSFATVNLPMTQLLAKFLASQLHKSLGLLVFRLVLGRLARRARRPAPELCGLSKRMRRLARLGQAALYTLLLAVPVLSWLVAQTAAGPVPTTLFLVIPVPHLLEPDPALHAWLRPLLVRMLGGAPARNGDGVPLREAP